MIRIKLENIGNVQAMILAAGKQARYAASRAINTVAFDVMREGREYIGGKINANNWTKTAWYVRKKASKDDLSAAVGWSDYLSNKRGHAAEYYLSQHWQGGSRQLKAFESKLNRAGILPNGMFTRPGNAAKEMGFIDARGNFKPGVLVQIISALGANIDRGYTANANAAKGKKISASKLSSRQVYWAGKPGKNTPMGIWAVDEKHSKRGRLRPVIIFIKRAKYKKVMDLGEIANKDRSERFSDEFWREYRNALRSAR